MENKNFILKRFNEYSKIKKRLIKEGDYKGEQLIDMIVEELIDIILKDNGLEDTFENKEMLNTMFLLGKYSNKYETKLSKYYDGTNDG